MEALISEFEAVLGEVGVDQRDALVRVRDLIDSKIGSFVIETIEVGE
tara:strand:- start:573 stop:713 length:141 start_codon:yes stop_codon:yes gene_type:complete